MFQQGIIGTLIVIHKRFNLNNLRVFVFRPSDNEYFHSKKMNVELFTICSDFRLIIYPFASKPLFILMYSVNWLVKSLIRIIDCRSARKFVCACVAGLPVARGKVKNVNSNGHQS